MKHMKKLSKKAGVLLVLLVAGAIIAGAQLISFAFKDTATVSVTTLNTVMKVDTHYIPWTTTETFNKATGNTWWSNHTISMLDWTGGNVKVNLTATLVTGDLVVSFYDGANPVTFVTLGPLSSKVIGVKYSIPQWSNVTSGSVQINFLP